MNIVVLVAMMEEAEAILEDSRFGWEDRGSGIFRSNRAAFPLSLMLSGIGKVHSAWSLASALAEASAAESAWPKDPAAKAPTSSLAALGNVVAGDTQAVGENPAWRADRNLVISLGTSGSLGRTAVGSMVLCREFVEHDMDVSGIGYPPGVSPMSGARDPVYRTASADLLSAVAGILAEAGIPTVPGRTLSGDQFVNDARVAEAKRARFGGEAAVVVDMECAAIAKLRCTRAPGAYLALRYVSDNADHDAGTSWDNEVRKAAIAFDKALVVLAGI